MSFTSKDLMQSSIMQIVLLHVPLLNTTDANVINTMIYDKNDDLGIPYYVEYNPILTEPHPNTPVFNP